MGTEKVRKNFNYKKFRKKNGFTQLQMAIELKVSVGAYILWERGVSCPSYENNLKLVSFLERYNEGIK